MVKDGDLQEQLSAPIRRLFYINDWQQVGTTAELVCYLAQNRLDLQEIEQRADDEVIADLLASKTVSKPCLSSCGAHILSVRLCTPWGHCTRRWARV